MSFTLHLSSFNHKQLYRRLQQACDSWSLKLIKRLHVLLALPQVQSVSDVAQMLSVDEQTVRDYRNQYMLKGMASLVYKAPPERPSKPAKIQRQQLTKWLKVSPQDSGYTSGCWNTPMIQDPVQRHFVVVYHPHYIATLLKNMGFSYQKARFVSDHLSEAKRLKWRHTRWSKILRQAKQRKALLLFGDAASCARWGSLSYTLILRCHQPEVPTSSKRKAYKVFGLIDDFSGRFFYKAHTGPFNSQRDAAFLLDVLSQTPHHVVVIQDGARYHTIQAMPVFFEAHAERLTIEPLPAYSPDFNPIEHLWKKVKKEVTYLKHFPEFSDVQQEVDWALLHFAQPPNEIMVLMALYCEKLGRVDKAA